MTYTANPSRYDSMQYRRCGRSGLHLPLLSLGLWHNFGDIDSRSTARAMILRSFDLGITHFDLANNYGPPPGSAETNFGRILKEDLSAHRDELIISSKAGYDMWPGPYGEWGSRKYLLASLDQSLKRIGVDYVDIFYSHRPDRNTPFEETMGALVSAVQQGKALYVGISSYNPEETRQAVAILREHKVPCLIHQPSYSMLNRWVEDGLLDALEDEGMGCISFSPLAQGQLTNRYLLDIPSDSRAAKVHGFLQRKTIDEKLRSKLYKLREIAKERDQSLAQMALAWVLRHKAMTSVIIGASRVSQIEDNIGVIDRLDFSDGELARIDAALAD